MVWPFRRRPKGRHALGAAVTAIPSARPVAPHVAVPAAAEPAPAPVASAPAVPPPVEPAPLQEPVAVEPAAVVPSPAAEPVAPPAPVRPRGPRVELGFRDGSTAALAPGSEQAKALTDLASVLTQRD